MASRRVSALSARVFASLIMRAMRSASELPSPSDSRSRDTAVWVFAAALFDCCASAGLPAFAGDGPTAAFATASVELVEGSAPAVAGDAVATTALCVGCLIAALLAAAPDMRTTMLFSAYFSSIALMVLVRAPSTSTCFSAPLATANSVPRTASVVLGVTTLKSFVRPTLSTLKSARPLFTDTVVRSVSPSFTTDGIWNIVPASMSAVALSPTRSAANDLSPVRTSAPEVTTSSTFACCQGWSGPDRHCTLPFTSMKSALRACASGAACPAAAGAAGAAEGACACDIAATSPSESSMAATDVPPRGPRGLATVVIWSRSAGLGCMSVLVRSEAMTRGTSSPTRVAPRRCGAPRRHVRHTWQGRTGRPSDTRHRPARTVPSK